MTFWKLKASLMTCGGQNHVIWLQIIQILKTDYKTICRNDIAHFVCCLSLFFSTRPQKSATLPPFLTEVLPLSRSTLVISILTKVSLVFLICNVFISKTAQGMKLFHSKGCLLEMTWLQQKNTNLSMYIFIHSEHSEKGGSKSHQIGNPILPSTKQDMYN